jgi:hypothetical protein
VKAAFVLIGIAAPLVALVLSIPLAATPFAGDPRGFFGPYLLTALPTYAGVLGAPGYLYALVLRKDRRQVGGPTRAWVRLSLALAGFASAMGTVGSLMMPLFAPPAVVSFLCVASVLYWFERGWDGFLDAPPGPKRQS